MCGLVGFYSPDPTFDHLKGIVRLFEASKIRGLHSFGFSVPAHYPQDGIRTAKFHTLLETKAFLMQMHLNPPQILIGHNRYSTSGDFHDHSNNQPIHVPGISLAFNGVISMKTKAEYEKEYKKLYSTENDGEILCRKILDGDEWQNWIAKAKFSFSGLILRNGEVCAITNGRRPLWSSVTRGGVFVASTNDVFTRATGFAAPRAFPIGIAVNLKDLL